AQSLFRNRAGVERNATFDLPKYPTVPRTNYRLPPAFLVRSMSRYLCAAIYQRALRSLEEPLIRHKIGPYGQDPPTFTSRTSGAELRYALEQALRFRRPAAVMIDEAQHLTKMASGRKLSDQLDSLKSLANLTGCVHVLIGTYGLLPCRNLSAQLSRRSIDIHFRRYRADDPKDVEAFQRVIFSFQRQLPLAEEPQL